MDNTHRTLAEVSAELSRRINDAEVNCTTLNMAEAFGLVAEALALMVAPATTPAPTPAPAG